MKPANRDDCVFEGGVAPGARTIQDPLTYAIIGAAQKVHRTLGPGFVESTYQKALAKELEDLGIPFVFEPEYEVFYEDQLCGTYRPDMVVAEKVTLELKAVAKLAPEHRAQAISYLRAAGLPVALFINFGSPSLEYRRMQN